MTIKELKDHIDYVARDSAPDRKVEIGIPDCALDIEIANIAAIRSLRGGDKIVIVLSAKRDDSNNKGADGN